jgi:hypothetical protein
MVNRASTGRRASVPHGAAGRLRADIDHGRTGDKVDWPDPAAAPLGTDAEAAGAPEPETAMEAAHRIERGAPSHSGPRRDRFGAAWILLVFIVVAGLAAATWILASL